MGFIGVPIEKEMITRMMQDLCIRQDRMVELFEMLNDGSKTGNPADELSRIIAHSTKANEVAFLSFMVGFGTGMGRIISQVREELPAVLTAASMIGAEHPDEIKRMVAEMTGDQSAPGAAPAATAAKKPDQTEDSDPMYR